MSGRLGGLGGIALVAACATPSGPAEPSGSTPVLAAPEPVALEGPIYDAEAPGAEPAEPAVRIPPSGFGHCVAGQTGLAAVTLRLDATAGGEPINVRVAESTDACFDRHAVRAVEKWRYEPAKMDGRPAAMRDVTTTIKFARSPNG